MSVVNLFRREALKQQYKTNAYGDAILTTPKFVNYAITLLLAGTVFIVFLSYIVPVDTSNKVALTQHDANFNPIVFPRDAVVEKHYFPNGSMVQKSSILSQLRIFNEKNLEQSISIKSNELGTFFKVSEPGEVIKAFEPVAKVLRKSDDDTFLFVLDFEGNRTLRPNQKVTLVSPSSGNFEGKVVAINQMSSRKTYINIQIMRPFDISLLNPNQQIKLIIPNQKRSLFALIRGDI